MTFYAVHCGRQTGIFPDWASCQTQITGFPGAKFKKFKTKADAEYFVTHGKLDIPEVKKITDFCPEKTTKVEKTPPPEDPSGSDLVIYTDGSLVRKKGQVWAGYGVYIPALDIKIAKPLEAPKTNNRAELLAIITALEQCQIHQKMTMIHLYTDSKYSLLICQGTGLKYQKNNYLNTDGTEVLNSDLIKRVLTLLPLFQLTFHHVRAHTGLSDRHSQGNEIADRLAVKGSGLDMIHSLGDPGDYPISFGKHSGTPLKNLPPNYLHWLRNNYLTSNPENEIFKQLECNIILDYLDNLN